MTALHADALERLCDEQQQIEELFETYARHRRDPAWRPAEAARLATLIFTLLRVHEGLVSSLLEPALVRGAGERHPVLAQAAGRRATVMEALERVEAMAPRDPAHAREMAALARQVRRWFEFDEHEVFELARDLAGSFLLNLATLDHDLATQQESLLSAGRAG